MRYVCLDIRWDMFGRTGWNYTSSSLAPSSGQVWSCSPRRCPQCIGTEYMMYSDPPFIEWQDPLHFHLINFKQWVLIRRKKLFLLFLCHINPHVYRRTLKWSIFNYKKNLTNRWFKVFCCESDIIIYKWRVTWNYVYIRPKCKNYGDFHFFI